MTLSQIDRLAAWRALSPDASMEVVDRDSPCNPHEVAAVARSVLASRATSLSEGDRLNILEQLMIAYLETANLAAAFDCYHQIAAKFPATKSVRTTRLLGLYQEAQEKYDDAFTTYKEALERDETNLPVLRRIVALLVSKGEKQQAIEQLAKYLDSFMQDAEGWLYIATLYLSECMYTQASFALEELIMLRPANHLYHLRYADVQATMGDHVLALKHYCRAVELCRDNVRGLYGIRLMVPRVSAAIKGSVKSRGSDTLNGAPSIETLGELEKLTETRLNDVYSLAKTDATIQAVIRAWLRNS
ncbi:hypothetical protein SeMB42_g07176 [Synchytrium endobioticum]|uniref:ER membrane protein complex subunit 2 n=1 Tax=Synchytrium endobioticum TaxID=286115 RepID=A0A507CCX1_9FUNG|nr:hypothetical protein SeMB42_g07176 [Synchytrium endobioticum]TPX40637.1 hypothetical protein SeLEV6574_g06517 [Synchytrium endobioticum]